LGSTGEHVPPVPPHSQSCEQTWKPMVPPLNFVMAVAEQDEAQVDPLNSET
jgi:hypothetical protein